MITTNEITKGQSAFLETLDWGSPNEIHQVLNWVERKLIYQGEPLEKDEISKLFFIRLLNDAVEELIKEQLAASNTTCRDVTRYQGA